MQNTLKVNNKDVDTNLFIKYIDYIFYQKKHLYVKHFHSPYITSWQTGQDEVDSGQTILEQTTQVKGMG